MRCLRVAPGRLCGGFRLGGGGIATRGDAVALPRCRRRARLSLRRTLGYNRY